MTNKKQLNALSKSLEQHIKENDREGIILKLAELQVLIDEPGYEHRELAFEIQEGITHDIIEASICKDIKEVDELFKEVDVAKIQIGKIPKPTKEEREYKKLLTKAEELEEKGLDPERAREVAAERLMEKQGFKKCVRCHEWIDVKHGMGRMALVMDAGLPYHKHCIEEKVSEMEEVLAGIPMMREGQEIDCSYCHEPIMARDPFKWECPECESFMSSALCKYYHAFAEPHPLSCWWKYRKEVKEV